MLLELPPELIQLVLQHSTTPAFVEAAFSCRSLYEIASSCREVILHHLGRIPGGIVNPELKSKQLFQLLIHRAFHELYGAQFHAACTQFAFGSDGKALDVKASSISHDHSTVALAMRGWSDVGLFRIENGKPHQETRFCSPFKTHPGTVEILRTAFDKDDGLYVLQRFIPAPSSSDANHPFIRQALQSSARGHLYLVRYSLQSSRDPLRVCSFPDHADYEPLALAAAHRNVFAVSWQHIREDHEMEVVLYNCQTHSSPDDASGLVELVYDSCILVDGSRERFDGDRRVNPGLGPHLLQTRGPIINLTFNDRSTQLLYYYKARTLYGAFQRINMSSFPVQPTLYDNTSPVQFSDTLSLLFSIDIPFFGTHATLVQNGRPMCQWRYLSFGLATHRSEDWTVACLLRSEATCSSHNCAHILNLDRGRRFPDWTIVARLWGFHDSTNSIGCIVAASNRGTRIAVANWRALYVWALEPNSLIEQNKDGFYPPTMLSSSGRLELRPIILPLNAVCFQLQFTDNENELLAITDRGMMCWYLHPTRAGRRAVQQIVV